jgi:glutamate 5-kinase
VKLENTAQRQALTEAERIVIKIGTRILIDPSGRPDMRRIHALVKEIAGLHDRKREIVLVSSGAIAVGLESMALKSRPNALPQLQMVAAVGQVRLMQIYERFFSRYGCTIAQVLLTHDDLKNRTRHLNARNTMLELLRHGIIPIVNENDVVSVDEIKFGDNDILASLVTILIEAEALLLLTTEDGLFSGYGTKNARRLSYLRSVTAPVLSLARGKGGPLTLGGMESKLQSAQAAAHIGARVVIADGRKRRIINRIFSGGDTGTLIGGSTKEKQSKMKGRKRWIAFFHKTHGTLTVDEGARRAIVENGHSLLPIGVKHIEGHFKKGTLVNVKSEEGHLIARGLVDYSSERLEKIMGHRSSEITSILGFKDYEEVIHRDNMVVLMEKGEDAG